MAALSARIGAAWDRFWFAPAPSNLLGLIRIAYGLWLVMKWNNWWGLYRLHEWRFPPRQVYSSPAEFTQAPGIFQMPNPPFHLLPSPPLAVYQALELAMTPLGLLMILGLGTRAVVPLAAGIYAYIGLHSGLNYSHHGVLLALVLIALATSPCGDHYSLDARLRRRPVPPLRPITHLRLLQVLTCALYASSTLGKLNEGWFTGRMMALLHDMGKMHGPYAETLYGLTGALGLSWFSLLTEGLLAVGLWIPGLRLAAILCGVMLHTGIDLMMPVTTFGYQSMSLYVAFLDPYPGRTAVLYDPARPGHRALVAAGRALNWLDRLRWEPRPGPLAVIPPSSGEVSGWRALREAALRLPLTFPLAFVLGAPLKLLARR